MVVRRLVGRGGGGGVGYKMLIVQVLASIEPCSQIPEFCIGFLVNKTPRLFQLITTFKSAEK